MKTLMVFVIVLLSSLTVLAQTANKPFFLKGSVVFLQAEMVKSVLPTGPWYIGGPHFSDQPIPKNSSKGQQWGMEGGVDHRIQMRDTSLNGVGYLCAQIRPDRPVYAGIGLECFVQTVVPDSGTWPFLANEDFKKQYKGFLKPYGDTSINMIILGAVTENFNLFFLKDNKVFVRSDVLESCFGGDYWCGGPEFSDNPKKGWGTEGGEHRVEMIKEINGVKYFSAGLRQPKKAGGVEFFIQQKKVDKTFPYWLDMVKYPVPPECLIPYTKVGGGVYWAINCKAQ